MYSFIKAGKHNCRNLPFFEGFKLFFICEFPGNPRRIQLEGMDPYRATMRRFAEDSAKEFRQGVTKEHMELLSRQFDLRHMNGEERKLLEDLALSNSKLARAFVEFATKKNPLKQNASEVTALELLGRAVAQMHNRHPGLCVRKLNGGGAAALYLDNGKLVDRSAKRPENATKSLDFIIEGGRRTILIGAKYTMGGGGAQDNQRKDLTALIREARGLDDDLALIALADGDHYTKPRRDGSTHLGMMQQIALECSERAEVCQYPGLGRAISKLMRP